MNEKLNEDKLEEDISSHIKELFKDFAGRYKASEHYLGVLRKDLGEIGQISYELIGNLKKKHAVLETFRKNRRKSVPSSSFVLTDQNPPMVDKHTEDLKAIDEKIESNKEHLKILEANHLAPHLASLKGGFDLLKKHIDEIDDAFENYFRGE